MLWVVKGKTKSEYDIGHGHKVELKIHVPKQSKDIKANENKVDEDQDRSHNTSWEEEDDAEDHNCTYDSHHLFPVKSILML